MAPPARLKSGQVSGQLKSPSSRVASRVASSRVASLRNTGEIDKKFGNKGQTPAEAQASFQEKHR
jgi:hypothetical protein